MRTGARTMSFAPFLAAIVGATAVTSATSPAAAEKVPPAFLGEWCQIGGTGKVTGAPLTGLIGVAAVRALIIA
jgi:hypothetical protein